MAIPIVMPRLGDFMMEGTVAKWSKSDGDSVGQGEVIAEIETEKLNYDLEATDGGILHLAVQEGAVVAVDGVMGYLLAEGEAPPEAPAKSAPTAAVPAPARRTPAGPAATRAAGDVVPSTPGARRLAANLEVDISQVTPTGPRGRVTDADVRAHAEQQKAAKAPRTPPGLPTPSKVVPLDGMRQAISTHMRDSLSGTAQLSYFLDVDVTDLQRLRREASRDMEGSIGVPDVLIKACAESLKRVPLLNTVLADGHILHFDQINIGLAVALDDGLIVPVVRNVEDKDLRQISAETADLATKAKAGKLSSDEVVGGTFTISVLGTVEGFTPILNSGQSALLGVGRPMEKPVVRSGEVVIREMMTVSLTADHQVVDGAIAANFLRRFQSLVERPTPLFK
jgi:pyruvate dehydrogenase E2 component (dihydrolipoamide acetyltransferase)